MLVRPARVRGDLLWGRSPLLDVAYREPKSNQHIDVACQGSVLLDHIFGQPVGGTRPFIQVAVDGPNLAARSIERPARLGWCRQNRMLHPEYEARPPHDGPAPSRRQPVRARDPDAGPRPL